jgi:hypothetical protein
MAESSDLWTLHLVYQLSQVPQGFDEDVLRRVRAIEGVTRVAVVPSSDASTHLAFSTRYSQVVARRQRGQTRPPRGSRRPQCHVGVVAAESETPGRVSRAKGCVAPLCPPLAEVELCRSSVRRISVRLPRFWHA